MRALKLKADVEADHSVRLELPSDVPQGPAEVIVLIDESDESEVHRPHLTLSQLLPRLRGEGGRSRHELDLDIAKERASWGD